jgi:hypothetical protein
MGADRFEAREGWVPANPEGSVWCYRTRGNAGVLAFRRTEDGQSLYEATHQDCYASDETITTTRRVDAVRFAATGAGEIGGDVADAGAAPAGADEAASSASPPVSPEPSPRPALGDRAGAVRSAYDRYIDATSEFLQHVRANLDDTTHADLLGSVDQALALVRDASQAPQREHEPHDPLSTSLGAVLRKARELIAAERDRLPS